MSDKCAYVDLKNASICNRPVVKGTKYCEKHPDGLPDGWWSRLWKELNRPLTEEEIKKGAKEGTRVLIQILISILTNLADMKIISEREKEIFCEAISCLPDEPDTELIARLENMFSPFQREIVALTILVVLRIYPDFSTNEEKCFDVEVSPNAADPTVTAEGITVAASPVVSASDAIRKEIYKSLTRGMED